MQAAQDSSALAHNHVAYQNKAKPKLSFKSWVLSFIMGTSDKEEICWEEFEADYLNIEGCVDGLDVVDNKWVRVQLVDLDRQPWFYIGNIDIFERKMTDAQKELNLSPKVKVHYTQYV